MVAVKGDEDVLAGLGYKQEFKREFGLVHVRHIPRIPARALSSHDSGAVIRPHIFEYRTLSEYCVRINANNTHNHATFLRRYSSVLSIALGNGGAAALVWGVSVFEAYYELSH
jgi:hypothetical protein